MTNRIIYTPKSKQNAKLQLLCIPYAGASVSAFYNWKSYLPDVELALIAYPGRYHRLNEAPIADIDVILKTIVNECKSVLNKNFAIFGHGIGAFIGYALTEELIKSDMTPKCLFVSGVGAPFHYKNKKNELSTLPDDQLIKILTERYNAIPDIILQDPELIKMFLPYIRTDMSLEEQFMEKYAKNDNTQLPCDITAFGGLEDLTGATEKVLSTWQLVTTGKFRKKIFPGAHFYLNEYPKIVCNEILHNIQ